MKRCPKCKAKLQKGRRRCPECGEFVASKKIIKNEKMKKYIAAGAAVVIAIAVLILIFLPMGGKKNSTLYMSATEMSFVKEGSNKTVELTEDLVYENSMDQFDLEYMANYYYSKLIRMNKKQNLVFFPSNIIRLNNYTLSYRNVKETDVETVNIANKVSEYKISEDGKCVVYISDGGLYIYDGNESQLIVQGVTKFEFSQDGKTVIYADYDRNLYSYQSGKAKKIAKDISALVKVSEDAKEIYYIKGTDLYKKVNGKDAKKMVKNVSSIVAMYESGEIYFLKDGNSEFSLGNYVEYDEKKDDLKKELKEHTTETHLYELCFFDGKKVKSVATGVQQESIQFATERPVVFYASHNFENIKKIKASEVENVWELEERVLNQVTEDENYQVAVNSKVSSIKQNDIEYTILSESGDVLYFVADVADKNISTATGDLYKVTISGSKAGKAKKYDEGVYARNLDFVGKAGVLYYKNVAEVTYTMQGELYVNKKCVDNNVKLGTAVCYSDVDDDTVFYLTNWRYQESMGTLKKAKDGKAVEIRKSAHAFYSMKKGEVLFIADYDVEMFAGNLYRHTGRKTKKIDTKVIAIMQNK